MLFYFLLGAVAAHSNRSESFSLVAVQPVLLYFKPLDYNHELYASDDKNNVTNHIWGYIDSRHAVVLEWPPGFLGFDVYGRLVVQQDPLCGFTHRKGELWFEDDNVWLVCDLLVYYGVEGCDDVLLNVVGQLGAIPDFF